MKHRLVQACAAIFAAASVAACVPVVVPIPISTSSSAQKQTTGYQAQSSGATVQKTAAVGKPPRSANCPTPDDAKARRAEVLKLVNAQRRAHGLGSLNSSPRLTTAAQHHACDNAAQGTYSHVGSDGSNLKTRLLRAGFRPRVAVENTGIGFRDSTRMVDFWMNSKYHRANILNPKIKQFGLGFARPYNGRPSWVLNMGTPK